MMKINYMIRLLRLLSVTVALLFAPLTATAAGLSPKGDVNLDGEVTIADVNSVIDVILNSDVLPTADVNGDGEINIADVNALIDIILNGGVDPLLEVCERVSEIDHEIGKCFDECETFEEFKKHADEFQAMDGVDYIYFNDDSTIFVEMKDFGTMIYSYYPMPDSSDVTVMAQQLQQLNAQDLVTSRRHAIGYQDFESPKVLIVNQQSKDESRDYAKLSANLVSTLFSQAGCDVSPVENAPSVEFFRNGLFDCDYLFLITHGCYGYDPVKEQGTHWMMTSDEIAMKYNIFIGDYADPDALAELRKKYDRQDVSYGKVKEKRNGKTVSVGYLFVSQHFISTSTNSFLHPGKAMFFNVACESMMGQNGEIDPGLADIFIDKGAGAYLGYDRSNYGGQVAGLIFWSWMLSGMPIENAYMCLANDLVHEDHNDYRANLILYPEHDDFMSTVINRPSISYEDKSDESMLHIVLHAGNVNTLMIERTSYSSWNIITSTSLLRQHLPFRYGFELSESEQFSDAVSLGEKTIGDDGCGFTPVGYDLNMTQSLTYDDSQTDAKIKPNTSYWVRAYVHDYVMDCYNYSEPVTFTTGSVKYVPQVETIPVGSTGVSIPMVAVEGGTFMMGATDEQGSDAKSNEKPAHQVTLSDFKMAQFPVTQELWQAVMGDNPSHFTGDVKRPVEYMTWNDCQTFISKLNALTGRQFRLPTEAEWEYAARGGQHDIVSKYSGGDDPYEVGWFYFNAESTTHPVGQKAPNELGIYDMSGNVYEFCQDWYGEYSSASQTNPTGPANGEYRVMRGGYWGSTAVACRVSYRNGMYPTMVDCTVGFRLAMDAD